VLRALGWRAMIPSKDWTTTTWPGIVDLSLEARFLRHQLRNTVVPLITTYHDNRLPKLRSGERLSERRTWKCNK
jgi:hypothetical protein